MYDNGFAELNLLEGALNKDQDSVDARLASMTRGEREHFITAIDFIHARMDVVPPEELGR